MLLSGAWLDYNLKAVFFLNMCVYVAQFNKCMSVTRQGKEILSSVWVFPRL